MSVLQRVHMPSVDGATGWVRSDPLGPAELRVVNFWTCAALDTARVHGVERPVAAGSDRPVSARKLQAGRVDELPAPTRVERLAFVLGTAALKMLRADEAAPRWNGLDLPGALLATASLGTLVFALSQASSAGWTSFQTLGLGCLALAGLGAFAIVELHTERPLLRVQRLSDRAVGGGFLMMLAVSSVLFGSFLLVSLYLQEALSTGPLATGLAFLPLAVALAAGVHVGTHLVTRAGVRLPMASGFGVAALGMLLLTGVDPGGSYLGDVLPGMLVTGVGLGVVLVSVSVSMMTSARDDETGMLSGLNTTGHEIGGSIGIATLATIATGTTGSLTSGIGDAFLVAAAIAAVASVVTLVVLPSATDFLPKLRLAPRIAVH
jgi:hypothetical protein